jgi:hypothetical protein
MKRIVVIALLVALATGPLSSAEITRGPAYSGQFVADSEAPLDFKVLSRRGEPVKVRFNGRGIPIRCEDEPVLRRYDRLGVTAKFLSPRTFEGRIVAIPNEGFRELFKLQGRLRSGGRAQGFVFYWRDTGDEPETDDECSTEGLLRWTADRQG